MSAIVLTGVDVWDGVSDSLRSGPLHVRIESGRIAAIGSDPDLSRNAERYELPGCVVLPGLIDAHVHLDLDPRGPAPNRQRQVPLVERRAAARSRAQAMLRAGITTARDLGGPDGLALELRDAIERGETEGPRLLCAGQPLTCPGGHCAFWGGEVESAREVRDHVRRQSAADVEWIKVMASGGVLTRGSRIQDSQFNEVRLSQIVSEARAWGRPVAAHCHGTRSIGEAARAGVRTIEHCSFAGPAGFGSDLDPSVVEALASSGAFVSPTVNAGWARLLEAQGGENPFATRMRLCLRTLRDAGVPLVASTDAGIPNVAHDGLPEALPVLAELAGLSPVETLRTATSAAARALGLEARTGSLLPGLEADLLVVDGDPLRELAALQRPRLVVARGQVIHPAGP